jgi:hypothetical protein
MDIFAALLSDPLRLLASNTVKRWQKAKDNDIKNYRVTLIMLSV